MASAPVPANSDLQISEDLAGTKSYNKKSSIEVPVKNLATKDSTIPYKLVMANFCPPKLSSFRPNLKYNSFATWSIVVVALIILLSFATGVSALAVPAPVKAVPLVEKRGHCASDPDYLQNAGGWCQDWDNAGGALVLEMKVLVSALFLVICVGLSY
jgi:uncharacterized membrane protein